MCRRTEDEIGPTVGLPRHRHFEGFFLPYPSKHRYGTLIFYGYSEKPPNFNRLLRHARVYGGPIDDRNDDVDADAAAAAAAAADDDDDDDDDAVGPLSLKGSLFTFF